VSLILDALKKLEREKESPDRGFLVVAHVPWASRSAGRARWIAFAFGLGLVVIAGVFYFAMSRRPASVNAPVPAAAVPSAASLPAPVDSTARPSANGSSAQGSSTATVPTADAALAPGPASDRASGQLPTPGETTDRAGPTAGPARSDAGTRSPASSPKPAPEGVDGKTGARDDPREDDASAVASDSGAPAEPELRLNAISRQDGHPVAVLNDRLVREGDVFDGIRVVRIGESEVEVEVAGERKIVRF
jgi:hypothetical protein